MRKVKYAKKSYGGRFRKRRLRKSKYGRFGRAVRSANRRFGRSKIIVPRNNLAPKNCFIKVRGVRYWYSNSGADLINTELVIRGNCLVDPFYNQSSDSVDKKLLYYGRMYNRYYCYASKVKVTWIDGYNHGTATATFPLVIGLAPTFSTSTISDDVSMSYVPTDYLPPAELLPKSKYKYLAFPNYGAKGTTVLQHKMSTKKMFEKNTKTDDDYTAAMVTTDSTVLPGSPSRQWFWHLFARRPDLLNTGTYGASEVLGHAIVDVTWYCMLYTQRQEAAVTDVT